MYCTYCNFENNSGNKFCESCGKPLDETLADTQPIRHQVSENKNNKSMSGKQSENKLNVISRFKTILVICIGLALLVAALLSFGKNPQSSPDKTAEAIMEAASAGNQNQLNELTIGDLQDHFIHDWLIERCRGVSVSDLNIQDGGDAGSGWNAQRFEIYRGTKDVVTLYITKIGDKFYMNNAYFGQEDACQGY